MGGRERAGRRLPDERRLGVVQLAFGHLEVDPRVRGQRKPNVSPAASQGVAKRLAELREQRTQGPRTSRRGAWPECGGELCTRQVAEAVQHEIGEEELSLLTAEPVDG